MPGGRLRHQDRQTIAAGLAEGLGYAEIARQLDRPTSTISREIARNGGPAGYRADHAHYATESRARRSRRPPGEVLDHAGAGPGRQRVEADEADEDGRDPGRQRVELDEYGRDAVAVREYAERFAELMVEAGLPRMVARVLASLYTTDSRSLTAAELVRQLRVSPASISKAIAYLEKVEMIERRRETGQRHEYYVIEDDVWLRAWMTSARTNADWAEAAQYGAKLFGLETPAGSRLDKMGVFFAQLSDDMNGGPTAIAADDAMTVLAALIHAGTPLTAPQLSTALTWPRPRVDDALQAAETYAYFTDPVVINHHPDDTYTVIAKPLRLTATQRKALTAHAPTAV
ncbi:helix-turn-helix domain-containing protein [Kribbella qitaiheensis]|uniref:Helix-turn-helix domain-containing protein n=1 Tax=Kribbella qitaiheensis TaxID=1544730 RepID=A0A7G6X4W0_9ACTN|nr:MarR family transcriptional regulator [Kribbella qitaiheensis]QNE21275.1 helix-turn-helix domain-containing protein [Kribbella qitaiheensis]